jgi:hypothetical protein
MKKILKNTFILIVYLFLSVQVIGQTSLNKYPYAQIKNDSLEFVFSNNQEKKLREISEFKKNCYKHVDYLNSVILRKDTLISNQDNIISLQTNQINNYKKLEKTLNSKVTAIDSDNSKLEYNNHQLALKLKDEELDKNKWKNRTIALSSVIVIGLGFAIML